MSKKLAFTAVVPAGCGMPVGPALLALLTEALIEREIRTSIRHEQIAGLPLDPELRNCPASSAPRVLEILTHVERHLLIRDDEVMQVFEPELTPLQHKVLDLLHVPAAVYTCTTSPEVGGQIGHEKCGTSALTV